MKKEYLTVIVEIGVNHEGSLDEALAMIEKAVLVGAKVIKFQAYTPEKYSTKGNPERFKRVKNFSLLEADFKILSLKCEELGVEFLCTPLTEDWVEKLNPLCSRFKIASGDITFKPVIQKAAQTGKPLIISTGAATVEEIDQAVQWVEEIVGKDYLKDRLTLMHCVAAYPVPVDQANVLSIPFLRDRYGEKGIKIGYSNHVIGLGACLAAVAHGADVIEVHFTDQKQGRAFRDHELSFDEADLKQFLTLSHEIKNSLGTYEKKVQPCEQEMIPQLRKGIIAAKPLKAGQILQSDDLMYARPATEFTSNQIEDLLGKAVNEDIQEGYLIPRKAIK